MSSETSSPKETPAAAIPVAQPAIADAGELVAGIYTIIRFIADWAIRVLLLVVLVLWLVDRADLEREKKRIRDELKKSQLFGG